MEAEEQLKEYTLQLQQVEAALTVNPGNDELLKLKNDLREVITLTTELIAAQEIENITTNHSSQKVASTSNYTDTSSINWNVGDKCLAPYEDGGPLYDAVIEEILGDGTCTVTYSAYHDTEIVQLSSLQAQDDSYKKVEEKAVSSSTTNTSQSKKDLHKAQQEWKIKKRQKKANRLKTLEEEREKEKNKWVDFNTKLYRMTGKKPKKSIFATPDSSDGRVGIGTCGVAGKPMTSFVIAEKYKKH